MHTPVVSIIVPVYNAEKYLYRCLDSLKCQSFTDFEVILVDDGSPDDSGYICDTYASKDLRFRVIHQQNGGVSVARQTGLNEAKGEYVIHADPDDWVEKDWIAQLISKIREEDADIAICDFDKILKRKTVVFHEDPFSDMSTDIIEKLLSGKLWGGCINKLVRREMFTKFGISFVPSMSMWEDLYVSCRLMMNSLKVTYVPKVLYHYDSGVNSKSLCKRFDDRRIESAKLFVELLEPHLLDKRYSDLWFQKKSVIKTWAFRTGYRGKILQDLFSEINRRYIDEAKKKPFWNMMYCVSLYLSGRSVIGFVFYQLAKVAVFFKHIIGKA